MVKRGNKGVLKKSGSAETLNTICEICNGLCGMNIELKEGKVIKVGGRRENIISRGFLCPKGDAVKEIVNAPDRLKRPLIKNKEGKWEEVSFSDAVIHIAEKFNAIREKYGSEALAFHVGRAGVRKEFTGCLERLSVALGTPNFSTAGSHCHLSKKMAGLMTFGALPIPDFENSRCIVLWGSNPAKSCPVIMKSINKAVNNGAKLIVIDPRKITTAEKSDFHLQVRPGTDGALALAILNVIIEKELYDKKFVKDWTVGFTELRSLVAGYTPEKAEEITGVSANIIAESANMYANNSPACISLGIAIELQTNGFQTARAVSVIQAVCGNLDVSGGALFASPAKVNTIKPENKKNTMPAIGSDEFPLFYKYYKNAQANTYARAILEGKPYPLKALMVTGSNPVLTWPNANHVKKAFASLDFLVVVDTDMTQTAELADVVVPVSTFLSRTELCDYAVLNGTHRISLSAKVLDEALMNDWEFCRELAVAMGFEKYLPWKNDEEYLNHRLKPLGIDINVLKQVSDKGYEYKKTEEKKYLKSGFATPSGKVEIYSEELEQLGFNSLPVYTEPAESPASSTPELLSKYPLILTTGARTMSYVHSRFHNIPSLRKTEPEPAAEIHPETAYNLGVENGEEVVVETRRGRIKIKAKITEAILTGVIAIPHGWNEANANLLTDDEELDPVTGFPPDRALLASIKKV